VAAITTRAERKAKEAVNNLSNNYCTAGTARVALTAKATVTARAAITDRK
jgi:hypothetical protein